MFYYEYHNAINTDAEWKPPTQPERLFGAGGRTRPREARPRSRRNYLYSQVNKSRQQAGGTAATPGPAPARARLVKRHLARPKRRPPALNTSRIFLVHQSAGPFLAVGRRWPEGPSPGGKLEGGLAAIPGQADWPGGLARREGQARGPGERARRGLWRWAGVSTAGTLSPSLQGGIHGAPRPPPEPPPGPESCESRPPPEPPPGPEFCDLCRSARTRTRPPRLTLWTPSPQPSPARGEGARARPPREGGGSKI